MKKIAIVTDSNSGITQAQAKRLGIEVIPMPFFIDGKLYLEDITLTQEEFYQHLTQDSDISTSQRAGRNNGIMGSPFGRVRGDCTHSDVQWIEQFV